MGIGRGGKRKGAGRKLGAATKKTREIANREAANGSTPLEVMVEAMREERALADNSKLSADDRRQHRLASAKIASDAAPYFHARLASTVVKMDIESRAIVNDEPLTPEQWEAQHGTEH